MSSKYRDVPVTMVRIRREEKSGLVKYDDNVTVGMPIDEKTDTVYLRIAVNRKTIVTDELHNFQWLDDSSSEGVTTLDSPSMQIIIIYDRKDRRLLDFFAQMNEYLSQDKQEEPSELAVSEDPRENAINNLVQYIRDGSSKKVEHPVEYLAENRLKIKFNLLNRHDDKGESKGKQSAAAAPVDVLELKLQVECHLNKQPLLQTIYVLSGTKLHQLKEQIEQETEINSKDQYWFAFGRYLIDDEYVFGSTKPVVPPRPVTALNKQAIPPKEPIQSGDTLIMCIAQLRPHH